VREERGVGGYWERAAAQVVERATLAHCRGARIINNYLNDDKNINKRITNKSN